VGLGVPAGRPSPGGRRSVPTFRLSWSVHGAWSPPGPHVGMHGVRSSTDGPQIDGHSQGSRIVSTRLACLTSSAAQRFTTSQRKGAVRRAMLSFWLSIGVSGDPRLTSLL
jgi:hypothetical protein